MKQNKTDKAQEFLFFWKSLAPMYGYEPVPEFGFTKIIGRKHRFDWAWPNLRIAVEVEGNAWNVAGGGKHMQDSDLEKYNLANELGWHVFRYSPSMLKNNPAVCVEQVMRALKLAEFRAVSLTPEREP